MPEVQLRLEAELADEAGITCWFLETGSRFISDLLVLLVKQNGK